MPGPPHVAVAPPEPLGAVLGELVELRGHVERAMEELRAGQADVCARVADLQRTLGRRPRAPAEIQQPSAQEPDVDIEEPPVEAGAPAVEDEVPCVDADSEQRQLQNVFRGKLIPEFRNSERHSTRTKFGDISQLLPSDDCFRQESVQSAASLLPAGWPTSLRSQQDAHPEWRNDSKFSTSQATPAPKVSLPCYVSRRTTNLEDIGAAFDGFVIDPSSRSRMFYSVVILFVLAYDLTLLPYLLAWEFDLTGVWYVSGWMTPIFWTCDIVVNFFTGVYKDGEFQKDLRLIAKKYCRTWFVPDFVVVCCDWVSVALAESAVREGGRGVKMLRFVKLGRLVAMTKLLRTLRLVRVLEEFFEKDMTEGARLILKLVTLFAGLMWAGHFVACLWFAVGAMAPSDTGARWIDYAGVEADGEYVPFLETGKLYQYMSSLHWACTQITLGGIDIMPKNSLERWVNTCAMMCSFLFGSTLVSMLAAAMMEYQLAHKDKTEKVVSLRRYLRENAVEARLAVLVQKQVEKRLNERKRLDEADVSALRLLSTALRGQLRFEIQRSVLTAYPVYRLWASLNPKWMYGACMRSVSLVTLLSKDELFTPGTTATGAYTLVSGELRYTQCPGYSVVMQEEQTLVEAGAWLCEAALWVEWVHVGVAEARERSELLAINAAAMLSSVQSEWVIRDIAVEYCEHFHKRVISACPPHAPFPNDLSVPFTDYCDLVVSMAQDVQVFIGREALQTLMERGGRTAKTLERLSREVESYKSLVVVLDTKRIMRIVSLVVLRAEDSLGRVFAEIAKVEGVHIKGRCQLPALKQEGDELVSETVARILDERLRPFKGVLNFSEFTREQYETESKEYGVYTRYLKSICSARMMDGKAFDAPCCRTIDTQDSCGDLSLDLAAQRILLSVQHTPVHMIPTSEGTFALYAWLSGTTMEGLNTPAGERALSAWMARVMLPEPQEEAQAASSAEA